MTLAECIVKTVFQVDEQSQSKVEGSINKIAGFAKKALSVIGIGFSIKGLSELAEAAAGVEALSSQFTQTFGEMEDSASSTLDRIANDTGIAVNRMKGSFVQIAAFAKTTGLDEAESLEIADRAMQAVADSAAFYDREIEQVTQTMQSFLKGNYANDAALGLSCTETTRNAAANTLYAKSFNDLSEAEKQLTLLYMVENANELSGALGQAARESDTWTNQLGNMKQGIADLKASAGAFVVKPMTDGVKALSEILRIATRWVQSLNGENNLLTRSYERASAAVKKVVDRFGGLENMMKLMVTLAIALGVAMNWSNIIGIVRNLTGVIGMMGNALNLANLKMAAMVAVIALIILAIEDFYHFMNGDDSVIGTIFEKAGIDAEEMRRKVVNIWNNLKTFFSGIWKSILAIFEPAIESIRKKLEDMFGGDLFSGIGTGVEAVINAIERITGALAGNTDLQDTVAGIITKVIGLIAAVKVGIPVVMSIIGVVQKLIGIMGGFGRAFAVVRSGIRFFQEFVSVAEGGMVVSKHMREITAILTTMQKIFGLIVSPIGAAAAVIGVLIAAFLTLWNTSEEFRNSIIGTFNRIIGKVKEFVSGIIGRLAGIGISFDGIKQLLSDLATSFDGILGFIKSIWMVFCSFLAPVFEGAFSAVARILSAVLDVITGLIDMFIGLNTGNWEQFWNGVKEIVSAEWNLIFGLFSDAIGIILGLIDAFLALFGTSLSEILSGVTETVGNIYNTVVGGIQKAIDWITSLPAEAVQWGADIINGIVDGIEGAIGGISDAARGIADKITSFLHFSTPDEGPLKDYESWMPDFMAGIAGGIRSNESDVIDAAREMAAKLAEQANIAVNTYGTGIVSGLRKVVAGASVIAGKAAASPRTAYSSVSTSNRSIVQNINISNRYSGDRDVQKTASKAMNKSATDATEQLANALKYA